MGCGSRILSFSLFFLVSFEFSTISSSRKTSWPVHRRKLSRLVKVLRSMTSDSGLMDVDRKSFRPRGLRYVQYSFNIGYGNGGSRISRVESVPRVSTTTTDTNFGQKVLKFSIQENASGNISFAKKQFRIKY